MRTSWTLSSSSTGSGCDQSLIRAGGGVAVGGLLSDPECIPAGLQAEDESFEKAIGGQTVGTVQTGGGDFASAPQAGERGLAVNVGGDAADHVVGSRSDGDGVAGDVQPELATDLADVREPSSDVLGGEMGQVEIHARVLGGFHLAGNGQADNVTRSEFQAVVEIGHEADAADVAEVRAFAADRLGDEVPGTAGDVQHGGVKLHELHVAELRPGPEGNGVAVAGGDGGVGGLAEDLARSAGGQDGLLGPHEGFAVLGIPHQCPAALAVDGEQVDDERPFPKGKVGLIAGSLNEGPHDLFAGGIAQGVGDAAVTVPPFLTQRQFAVDGIELCSPVDQFADAVGGIMNHAVDDVGIAQPFAGVEGVGDVVGEVVDGIEHAGDASLGPGAVGDGENVFAEDDGLERGGDFQRGTHAGNAAADDEHVGEHVGHPLGMKPQQIPARQRHGERDRRQQRSGHGRIAVLKKRRGGTNCPPQSIRRRGSHKIRHGGEVPAGGTGASAELRADRRAADKMRQPP